MSENPMDQLRVLMERFAELVEEHGLTLHQFAAIPMPEGHPPMVQAVMLIDTERAFADPEKLREDEAFAAIEKQFKIEEKNEKQQTQATAAIEDLTQMMRNDGGIGLGD